MNFKYASKVLGGCPLVLGLRAYTKTVAIRIPTTNRVIASWWKGSLGMKAETPSMAAALLREEDNNEG
jgi:hypothetical protein